MTENLMCGTEALNMLGVNHKKGKAQDLLKTFGIVPVFAKTIGRGTTIFVKRDDVSAAIKKEEIARAEQQAAIAKRQADLIFAGEKTRFVPTAEALEVLKRIESKVDRMLIMWGDKLDT